MSSIAHSPNGSMQSLRVSNFFVNMPPTKQTTRYCFTWNNYTDNDIELLRSFYVDFCKYLSVRQRSVGEKGTPICKDSSPYRQKHQLRASTKLSDPNLLLFWLLGVHLTKPPRTARKVNKSKMRQWDRFKKLRSQLRS